jgi:hypothetical protein
MPHAVRFFSQRAPKQVHRGFGCGVASLMMLLRHHRIPVPVPSYRQLCVCLWLSVPPSIKGWQQSDGMGAYWTDVERALRGMGSTNGELIKFSSITHEDPETALKSIRRALKVGPVMTGMWGRGFGGASGHWIVIVGYEKGKLLYLDPSCLRKKVLHLPAEDFPQHWASYALYLRHPCHCVQ